MNRKEYFERKVKPIIDGIMDSIAIEQPEDVAKHIAQWITIRNPQFSKGLSPEEKEELDLLREQVPKFRKLVNLNQNDSCSDTSDSSKKKSKKRLFSPDRHGVSAEAYGKFNEEKQQMEPASSINTGDLQAIQLRNKLSRIILFNGLTNHELITVMGYMREREVKANNLVLSQGSMSSVLYIVWSGEVESVDKTNKVVKTYKSNELLNEVALLYDTPQTTTLRAKTNCELLCLDRNIYNKVIKKSVLAKKSKYESYLKGIDILSTLSDSEISLLADALKEMSFKNGDIVYRIGEIGDEMYIVEEGDFVGVKGKGKGEMVFSSGSFFGELAILKPHQRVMDVRARGDGKVLVLERDAIQRVLGPLSELLKRDDEKYQKYFKQLK